MINCRRVVFGDISFYRTSLSFSSGLNFPATLDVLIDFRGRMAPSLISPFFKKIVHMPMDEVGEIYRSTPNPTVNELIDFYIEIVDRYRYEFSNLLRIVSSSPMVGFGCYFGKDRTGIASYLIGKKYDANINEIILDYTQSEFYLRENIDLFSAHWLKRNISKEEYIKRLSCPSQAIKTLDHYLIQRYGSINRYLGY